MTGKDGKGNSTGPESGTQSSNRHDKQRGVDASSAEFSGYDQVNRRQAYRLAEDQRHIATTSQEEAPAAEAGPATAEVFDEITTIQTCDIGRALHGDGRDRAAFAGELGRALEEIGFAILEGHGIRPSVHARAEQANLRLFEGHSVAAKQRYRAARHGSINQGYFGMEETSDIHPDLVEGWVFCRRAFSLPDGRPAPPDLGAFWPDPAAERDLRLLYLAQERLILPVMQSILTYLDCDPHFFDGRLTHPHFALRLNYYPPISASQDASGAGRLLGHEDVDLFTFVPAPRVEGLQVLNRRNGRWIRLQAPPGTIILNTGDYMQRITNDRLHSTTHRVSKPRDAAARRQTRVSSAMNVYLWEDEILEVLPGLGEPRYPPVRAEEFHTRTTSKFYGDEYAAD